MKVAIPTMGQGGMDCERSGHFGHCDCFTVVDIQDGEIAGTSVIDNPPHEEGGCLRPVSLLADNGIDAIVAAGKASAEAERQSKLREADAQTTALARAMCEKLLARNLTAQDDARLLDDLLEKAGAGNGN